MNEDRVCSNEMYERFFMNTIILSLTIYYVNFKNSFLYLLFFKRLCFKSCFTKRIINELIIIRGLAFSLNCQLKRPQLTI